MFLASLVFSLWYLDSLKTNTFLKTAVVTHAYFLNREYFYKRVNDMDGSSIRFDRITYRFSIDNDTTTSFFNIRPDQLDLYIDETLNVGDSILIRYSPSKFIHNEMLTLKESSDYK